MDGAPETDFAQPEVVRPCGEAWHCARAELFPVDVGRWLTLGFVTWLAMLAPAAWLPRFYHFADQGEPPFRLAGRHREFSRLWQRFDSWSAFAEAHLLLCLIGMIFVFAVYLVLAYLRSRGLFMYLDCVARRRAAVVEPWRNARRHALSFFCWQVAIDLVAGIILVLAAAAFAVAGYSLWRPRALMESADFNPGDAFFTPFLCAVFVFALLILARLFLIWTLRNLVATLMYVRGISGWRAWGNLLRLFLGHPGTFVLYLLVNMVLGALYVALLFPVCCCTCCIGALPVVNQTLLQPVLYWIRAYPLFFLAQFGPEYTLHAGFSPAPAGAAAAAQPPPAVPNALAPQEPVRIACCPQCGQPHQLPRGARGTYSCAKCGAHFEVS